MDSIKLSTPDSKLRNGDHAFSNLTLDVPKLDMLSSLTEHVRKAWSDVYQGCASTLEYAEVGAEVVGAAVLFRYAGQMTSTLSSLKQDLTVSDTLSRSLRFKTESSAILDQTPLSLPTVDLVRSVTAFGDVRTLPVAVESQTAYSFNAGVNLLMQAGDRSARGDSCQI